MPNGTNTYTTTQIPAPRVPVFDVKTGLISREWYLYFFNLFNLTGSGQNQYSIADLLVGPSDSALSTAEAVNMAVSQALAQTPSGNDLLSAIANLVADVQGLGVAPANTPQVPDSRYGVFSDTTTQTAAAINTAYAVTFNTTDLSNGVYIGTPTSRVYVDRPGVYNFQFSAQLNQSSSAAHDVWIWADINGTTQPNTGTQVTLVGNNAAAVAAWNFVFRLNAGDYFRLMWSTSNTSCQILAAAAVAPVPAIPSVILTVTDNIGITR